MKKKGLRLLLSLLVAIHLPGNLLSQNWQELNSGLNRTVSDFYSDTTDHRLYMSGYFGGADGEKASGVCYWDGINFNPMGCGFNKPCADTTIGWIPSGISAVTKYNGEIYAGGNITRADDKPVKYLAKWNGITWDSVGMCPNSQVTDLFVDSNNDLIAVGFFDTIGGVYSNGVAKWNGSTWSSIGGGLPFANPLVFSACEFQGEIYIGGNFQNNIYSINKIAKWNGSAWVNPGLRIYGSVAWVADMTVYNNELYVAGIFNSAGGNISSGILKYDGVTWSDVGGGFDASVYIRKMTIHNNELYTTGNFMQAGGISASGIAKWDGTQWCNLGPESIQGYAVASHEESLYLGCLQTIDSDTVNFIVKRVDGPFVELCGNTTSVAESLINTVSIYPNPATDHLTVEYENSNKNSIVTIQNTLGQTIYSEKITDSKFEIDIRTFPTGLYVLQLFDGQSILTKKFIKQ